MHCLKNIQLSPSHSFKVAEKQELAENMYLISLSHLPSFKVLKGTLELGVLTHAFFNEITKRYLFLEHTCSSLVFVEHEVPQSISSINGFTGTFIGTVS